LISQLKATYSVLNCIGLVLRIYFESSYKFGTAKRIAIVAIVGKEKTAESPTFAAVLIGTNGN